MFANIVYTQNERLKWQEINKQEKKREIRAERHRNMTAANGGVNYTASATKLK